MKYTRKKGGTREQSGAVLLIAVLVASVALTVGAGVYQRTYKELIFSSFWKQTQVAFATADAGLECAMFWDLHSAAAPNYCFGAVIPWTAGAATVPAGVNMNIANGCVNIVIDKNIVTSTTTIRARGYNDACGSTNPRRVERGLRIDY